MGSGVSAACPGLQPFPSVEEALKAGKSQAEIDAWMAEHGDALKALEKIVALGMQQQSTAPTTSPSQEAATTAAAVTPPLAGSPQESDDDVPASPSTSEAGNSSSEEPDPEENNTSEPTKQDEPVESCLTKKRRSSVDSNLPYDEVKALLGNF